MTTSQAMEPVLPDVPATAPDDRRFASLAFRRARRVLKRPSIAWGVLNAQLRLGRKVHVPLTVCLHGKVQVENKGEIRLGERVLIRATAAPVELIARHGGRLAVGEGTFINYGVSITAYHSVTIGRNCQIGHYTFIYDNDEHEVESKFTLAPSRPVILEDRVWLGTRVIVLKGVRIGHDSVIGAGSVVTHDVPPRSIAVGVPARVVRQF